MDLLCRRGSQKLILTGKVLFLTVSLGFAVPAIMETPIMTLLIPHTQVTPMVTKGSTNNSAEGTIEWTQTFGGLYKNVSSWMEQTADGGYIITGKTLSSDAGEEDVWLSKAAKPIGMEPIEINSDYTLDRDLTFSEDGFIVMADDITLDMNGHTITGSGGGNGVILEGRTGVTVKNGTIENFRCGFELRASSSTTLTGNTATNNTHGICLEDFCNNNILTGNTASANEIYGFILQESSGTTLAGNTATANTFVGFSLGMSNDTTLTANTASANDYAGFMLLYSSGTTLTGNTATNNRHTGFGLGASSGTTLTGNTATNNNLAGFVLTDSSGTILTGNTATNHHGGFALHNSNGTSLTGNTATDNYRIGFLMNGSSGNTLTANTATNNGHGIGLSLSSNNNTLTANTVSDNDDYGIYLEDSNGNTISNNFFDNDHNAADRGGTNAWNIAKTSGTNIIGGPYLGGNYWSDYRGVDADGDGLGDTPYEITGGANRDHLPLVEQPLTTTSPTPEGSFLIPGGTVCILLMTLLLAIRPVRRGKRKSK